jgi:hypothetical protein
MGDYKYNHCVHEPYVLQVNQDKLTPVIIEKIAKK